MRLIRELALVDWMLLAYHGTLVTVGVVGSGPGRGPAIAATATLLALVVVTIGLVRSRLLRGATAAALYRIVTVGSVVAAYFFLRPLLANVTHGTWDGALLAADRALFGELPAATLSRVPSPLVTEWFAGFYLAYFGVLLGHALPFLLFSRDRRAFTEFALALFTLTIVGHLGYFVVPAFGPEHLDPSPFTAPLPETPFLLAIRRAVEDAGPLRDAFPSLHTAGPVMFALFSFARRRTWPLRFTWPLSAFLAAQITASTLFLRFHYAVDVLAGIALAAGSLAFARRAAAWEVERRTRDGLAPAWPAWSGEATDGIATVRCHPQLTTQSPLSSVANHPQEAP